MTKFMFFIRDFYHYLRDWESFDIKFSRYLAEWKCFLATFADLVDVVAKVEGDVTNVANALAALRDAVAALELQIATAITPEQAAELHARLAAADAALDALAPDPVIEPEPEPVVE